jgi:hypothetical protein
MPAELPLVPSAIALASSALLFFLPGRASLVHRAAIGLVVLGAFLPVTLGPLIDPTRAAGRALWQWSAVGGPTIQASYRLDALSEVALALTAMYAGAAMATASRAERRHPALASLILAVGLVTIALVVTDDLVAAIVVLAVLAALTILALFAVTPVAATARAAAYLSIGLQAWVVAALLMSRSGSPTFLLGAVPSVAVTAGVMLAATLGALLFAGLYPVVAWSADETEASRDVGPLGSLVLMPAGIGATFLLVRLLGASDLTTSAISLPALSFEVRLAFVVLVLLAVALALAASGRVPLRPIAVGVIAILLVAVLPSLGWAHVVLISAILTAGYAGVVSLALPDHWETVRSDLALVAIWIAVATGSPLAIAGGIVALFARAAAAFASSLWLVPHRDYVALVGGSAVYVAGVVVVGAGALTGTEPAVIALAVAGVALLVALELAQVGRRFRVADVPPDLDLASAIAAFGLALLATIVVVPLEADLRTHLPGPGAITSTHIAAIAVGAALAVVLARTVRPLLPYFEAAAERSGPVMRALDPAPVGVGAFRAVEAAATRASTAFGLFERRAGVWLATAVIVALLIWAVR